MIVVRFASYACTGNYLGLSRETGARSRIESGMSGGGLFCTAFITCDTIGVVSNGISVYRIIATDLRVRTKFAFGFGVTGFLIGVTLCAYTFYVTPSHYKGPPPPAAVYLVLCPSSFAAMALDNAGVAAGLIGWFFISLMNAALYGIIGFGIGNKAENAQKVNLIRG